MFLRRNVVQGVQGEKGAFREQLSLLTVDIPGHETY